MSSVSDRERATAKSRSSSPPPAADSWANWCRSRADWKPSRSPAFRNATCGWSSARSAACIAIWAGFPAHADQAGLEICRHYLRLLRSIFVERVDGELTAGKGSSYLLFKTMPSLASLEKAPPPTSDMLTVAWQRVGQGHSVLIGYSARYRYRYVVVVRLITSRIPTAWRW